MKTFKPNAWATLAAAGLAMLSISANSQGRERTGQEVVAGVCAACHAKGEKGAPRIGDPQAWAKRSFQGLTALTAHALAGIRNMPAHGGSPSVSDTEIERAITYMVNRSGGHWIEPLAGDAPAATLSSEQIVQTYCAKCHQDGVNGAPKIGDRTAWVPRMKKGLDALVRSAVHGHGPMPARGNVANLSDLDIRGAVVYMFNYGATPLPSEPRPAAEAPNPYHKVVNGTDIYLGVVRSEAMPAGPAQASAPKGKGYRHVNISLFDAKTKLAISDAQVKVKVKVSDPIGIETKTLDAISTNNTTSYGGYFHMDSTNPYAITVQIQRPGSTQLTEAKFDYLAR